MSMSRHQIQQSWERAEEEQVNKASEMLQDSTSSFGNLDKFQNYMTSFGDIIEEKKTEEDLTDSEREMSPVFVRDIDPEGVEGFSPMIKSKSHREVKVMKSIKHRKIDLEPFFPNSRRTSQSNLSDPKIMKKENNRATVVKKVKSRKKLLMRVNIVLMNGEETKIPIFEGVDIAFSVMKFCLDEGIEDVALVEVLKRIIARDLDRIMKKKLKVKEREKKRSVAEEVGKHRVENVNGRFVKKGGQYKKVKLKAKIRPLNDPKNAVKNWKPSLSNRQRSITPTGLRLNKLRNSDFEMFSKPALSKTVDAFQNSQIQMEREYKQVKNKEKSLRKRVKDLKKGIAEVANRYMQRSTQRRFSSPTRTLFSNFEKKIYSNRSRKRKSQSKSRYPKTPNEKKMIPSYINSKANRKLKRKEKIFTSYHSLKKRIQQDYRSKSRQMGRKSSKDSRKGSRGRRLDEEMNSLVKSTNSSFNRSVYDKPMTSSHVYSNVRRLTPKKRNQSRKTSFKNLLKMGKTGKRSKKKRLERKPLNLPKTPKHVPSTIESIQSSVQLKMHDHVSIEKEDASEDNFTFGQQGKISNSGKESKRTESEILDKTIDLKVLQKIFELLDSDKDRLLSADCLDLENIPTEMLEHLELILYEIYKSKEPTNFLQFVRIVKENDLFDVLKKVSICV
jgi:hypothetical protein